MMIRAALLLLWTLGAGRVVVKADIGDYVDPTFNCPATVTCPVVCVASVADCPTVCEDAALVLCNDGNCMEECDEDIESPCEADCASVACPKVIDLQPVCLEEYGSYYEAATLCAEQEVEESTNLLSFNEFGYVFAYCWYSLLTASIFAWCAFNQRLNAAPAVQVQDQFGSPLWMTGYRFHWLGLMLNVLTVCSFLGWIALLAWLTIQYYALDGSVYVQNRTVHFPDEVQLLKTFIIVWSVGFTWSFALKWPYSIKSLFLRRCSLDRATHVAVFQEAENDGVDATTNKTTESSLYGWKCLQSVFSHAFAALHKFMAFLFSDQECWHYREGTFHYSRVRREVDGTRHMHFSVQRYNFDSDSQTFVPATWLVGTSLSDFSAQKEGLTNEESLERFYRVGPNAIKMKRPTFFMAFAREVLKPFYTYQLYMIWSWFPLYYYYMALVWTGVITTSAVMVSWFHYRNLCNLYRITHVHGEATVKRDGDWVSLDQTQLVPGDVVLLSPGIAQCDMILIAGRCLVDESALTGESNPKAKTVIDPIDHAAKYDRHAHKRHVIAAGTTVLEVEDSIAVVVNTGAATTKGELLRDIFSFQRHKLKFDAEVKIVLGILFLYAVFAFNMTVYFIDDVAAYGWFYGIYVVGTILPPLLPTVFTVSVGVSDNRLSQKRIATSNSESILIAGKVTRAFFDKTGTLTRQGLDYMGARSVEQWELSDAPLSDQLTMAMATCHSLTPSAEGHLVGNPVDRAMFDATVAKMKTPEVIEDEMGRKMTVVRHFDFDHHRMTQSVVVQLGDGSLVAFVKGSGESIQKLCKTESLPDDFESELQKSARDGIYQISVASKAIKTDSIAALTRDEVECDLQFIGVVNFHNAMRDETPDVIDQLDKAEVVSTMITGDSVLTGIRIASESGILEAGKQTFVGSLDNAGVVVWTTEDGNLVEAPGVDMLRGNDVQLAVSGKVWASLLEEDAKEANQIAPYIRVYGRCTPQDKVTVVRTFVDLGFVTLMCGDGGNDAGALKAAHVGVALSDAETSMVAPFASLDKDIRSVLDVLKEGRCALASALATYKYMILYGQIETINQMINAYFQITFAEWCWVFMDGVWTITMAFTLPLARPADRLSNTRPTASILGWHTLSSTLGVLVINFFFLVIALLLLFAQDWYQCRKWTDNDVSNVLVIGDNYESEVIFLVSGYQYISTAMAYNFGYEFRQSWFRNYLFVIASLTLTFVQFYAAMVPGDLSCFWRVNCDNNHLQIGVTTREKMPIQNPFNTTVMPEAFRWKILVIMIVNLFTIMAYDYFVVNGLRRRSAAQKRSKNSATPAVDELLEEVPGESA